MKYITPFLLILSLLCSKNLVASEPMNLNEISKVLKKAECLYTEKEIDHAVDKLAKEITEKVADKNPIILCVLKGAIVPTGMLLPKLNFPLVLDYIHGSRYKKDKGYELKIYAKPQTDLKGRVVLILDDIIDKGVTMQCLVDYCEKQGAKEIYTAALVDKNTERDAKGLLKADFVGLQIPDKFIIGAGLDYEGYFRNMPGIYLMPEDSRF